MKRCLYLFLLVCFSLFSCEKEETETIQESEDLLTSQEYFRAEIDGKSFEVHDLELMMGTIYPSPTSGIITFDFLGAIDDKEHYEEINFKVCFYDGPGTYYTGTTSSVSWADYYLNSEYWYNDYTLEDPGLVVVTEDDGEYITGTFDFNAFNYDDESIVHVVGEFKVLLEENDFE